MYVCMHTHTYMYMHARPKHTGGWVVDLILAFDALPPLTLVAHTYHTSHESYS